MKKIFLAILLAVPAVFNTQTRKPVLQSCLDYHKKFCKLPEGAAAEEGFEYNSQSKSGLFAPGETSTLRFVVYKGMDYRISICGDAIFGSTLKYVIKDSRTGELIYDNATDENAQEVEFTIESTKSLKIEIDAGGSSEKTAKSKTSSNQEEGGCIGLLILHKISEKTGF